MSISIQTVNPEDLIDAGRTKFNNNDVAVANGLTALQTQIDSHNHNGVYYLKSEVDSRIAASTPSKRYYLEFGIDGTGVTKVAGLTFDRIPIGYAAKIVGAIARNTSGSVVMLTGLNVLITAQGTVKVSIAHDPYVPDLDLYILKVSALDPGGIESGNLILKTTTIGPWIVVVEIEI